MIALRNGRVEQLTEGSRVLGVNGVGYMVQASTRTLGALSQPPATTRLLIETVVREDAIQLYGLAGPAERDWFRHAHHGARGGGERRAAGAVRFSAARPGGGHRRR
jgi:Holliday junction DNA helicase RuvA